MPELSQAKSLRDRLIEAGLTSKEVAKKLKVQPSAVSQWVTGRSRMRPRFVPLLAKLLKCSPQEIRETVEAGYSPSTRSPAGE